MSYVEGGIKAGDTQMGLIVSRSRFMKENRFMQQTQLGKKYRMSLLIGDTIRRGRREGRGRNSS